MATPRLDPTDVYHVADQLPLQKNEIDEDTWADCESARYRSTVSRAYYSVFLNLKAVLIESNKLPGPFPESGVHGKLHRALKNSIGPTHALTKKLDKLRTLRTNADYDLDMDIDLELAETCVDDADEAATIIETLDSVSISRIAKEL